MNCTSYLGRKMKTRKAKELKIHIKENTKINSMPCNKITKITNKIIE